MYAVFCNTIVYPVGSTVEEAVNHYFQCANSIRTPKTRDLTVRDLLEPDLPVVLPLTDRLAQEIDGKKVDLDRVDWALNCFDMKLDLGE